MALKSKLLLALWWRALPRWALRLPLAPRVRWLPQSQWVREREHHRARAVRDPDLAQAGQRVQWMPRSGRPRCLLVPRSGRPRCLLVPRSGRPRCLLVPRSDRPRSRRCPLPMSPYPRRQQRPGIEPGLCPRRRTLWFAAHGTMPECSPFQCYRAGSEITLRGCDRERSAGRRWECRDRRDMGN